MRKWTDEQLIEACKNNVSCRSTLMALGLKGGGGGTALMINKHIQRLSIDISHWSGKGYLKGKNHNHNEMVPLESVLTVQSSYSRGSIKRRLIKEGILKNECSICGQKPEWCGKPLIMRLDHINGINDDNRLENLRLLCPHCDSQTETFCGRNKQKATSKTEYRCRSCGNIMSRKTEKRLCMSCIRLSKNNIRNGEVAQRLEA